jgi:RNA polymerase sigma factor (sigma-70 family)
MLSAAPPGDSVAGHGQPALPFADLYELQFAYVWRTLRALGVDAEQIEDAVQDAFLVVHRRLGEFEGRARIETWLFAIAQRVAQRYRRTAARRTASRSSASESSGAGETRCAGFMVRGRTSRSRGDTESAPREALCVGAPALQTRRALGATSHERAR